MVDSLSVVLISLIACSFCMKTKTFFDIALMSHCRQEAIGYVSTWMSDRLLSLLISLMVLHLMHKNQIILALFQ